MKGLGTRHGLEMDKREGGPSSVLLSFVSLFSWHCC